MTIKWYGHSCFLITSATGTRILTDPCDPSTGYVLSNIEADGVTISHDHYDHNYLAAVSGNPIIVRTEAERWVKDVKIMGIPTWHDEAEGKKRGANLIYVIEMDGMRLVHLGDLGHALDEETLKKIGVTNILFAPVGGVYTIDYTQAREIANALHTNVLIPMHYATADCKVDIGPVMPLMRVARNCKVHKLNECECSVDSASLGEDRILVFDYYRPQMDEAAE